MSRRTRRVGLHISGTKRRVPFLVRRGGSFQFFSSPQKSRKACIAHKSLKICERCRLATTVRIESSAHHSDKSFIVDWDPKAASSSIERKFVSPKSRTVIRLAISLHNGLQPRVVRVRPAVRYRNCPGIGMGGLAWTML